MPFGLVPGANSDWLTVVHLPAYAPDLNAVEGAWSVMKSELAFYLCHTPQPAPLAVLVFPTGLGPPWPASS